MSDQERMNMGRESDRLRKRATLAYRKANNLCSYCGSPEKRSDRAMCDECLRKDRIKTAKKRGTWVESDPALPIAPYADIDIWSNPDSDLAKAIEQAELDLAEAI